MCALARGSCAASPCAASKYSAADARTTSLPWRAAQRRALARRPHHHDRARRELRREDLVPADQAAPARRPTYRSSSRVNAGWPQPTRAPVLRRRPRARTATESASSAPARTSRANARPAPLVQSVPRPHASCGYARSAAPACAGEVDLGNDRHVAARGVRDDVAHVGLRVALAARPERGIAGVLQSPGLVVGEVPVEDVELVVRGDVDVALDHRDRKEVPCDVQVDAAPAVLGRSLIGDRARAETMPGPRTRSARASASA